jgi:hypothetical protein
MAPRRTRASAQTEPDHRLDAVPGRRFNLTAERNRSVPHPAWSSGVQKLLIAAAVQRSEPSRAGWSEWGGSL